MPKRNLTLLIIILVIIAIGSFAFFYFYKPTNPVITDTGSITNFISEFNPFGKSKTINTTTKEENTTDVSGYVPTTISDVPKGVLTKVSSFPVAGFGLFMKERFKDVPVIEKPVEPVVVEPAIPEVKTTTKTTKKAVTKPTAPPTEFIGAIRYVNKATGNIYQTFTDKIEERRFTTTTIPRVYEAYFGNKGESVVMRYLKVDNQTIETFIGSLPKELLGADTTSSNEVKGSFLPENISDVSVAPDTSKLFYLFNTNESVAGIITNMLDNAKSQIFDSQFTEWLSFWPNTKMITLTTKPSSNVPGYMYAVDPAKKDFTKLLGGINGLTTLTSPDGKSVLYSNNNLILNVYSIATREYNIMGVKTLSEKCIWTKNSEVVYCAIPKFVEPSSYPDAWYQGEVSFSDQIWKIEIKSGNMKMLIDPATVEGGEDIDGTKLALDENENSLFFINKKDSYLWYLDLKQVLNN